MDVVALTDLATSADTEAPLLAHDLGVTAFEARQKLAAGLPCVVLFAPERGRTLALLDSLRRRGHGALAFDSAAVVASSAMVAVRRFHLDGDALVLDAAADGPQGAATETRVSFADMIAMVRATHRHSFETHEESKEKRFRPAAAIATGGLVLTKTVKRDIIRTAEERVQVLYIFRRGEIPRLLRETTAQYGGLGVAVRPTRLENFATTLRLLRERAPGVPFDERLLSVKKFPAPPSEPGAPRVFDPETGGVDLLAHVLAMSLSRSAAAGPGVASPHPG